MKRVLVLLTGTLMLTVALGGAKANEINSLHSLSPAKYLARIEHKQAFLLFMAEKKEDITRTDVSSGASAAGEAEKTLSNSKYSERLEGKLGMLVKESIPETGNMKLTVPPVFSHTLNPESGFDKIKTEEVNKEDTLLEKSHTAIE